MEERPKKELLDTPEEQKAEDSVKVEQSELLSSEMKKESKIVEPEDKTVKIPSSNDVFSQEKSNGSVSDYKDIQVLDEVVSGDELISANNQPIKDVDGDDDLLVLEDCQFDDFEDGEFEVQDEEMEEEEFNPTTTDFVEQNNTEIPASNQSVSTIVNCSLESDGEDQNFVVKDELIDGQLNNSSNTQDCSDVKDSSNVPNDNQTDRVTEDHLNAAKEEDMRNVVDMSVLSEEILDESGLEEFDSAIKQFGSMKETSLHLHCALCGDFIPSVKNWVCHHYEKKHRRVVAWVNHFRNKCIECHDPDAISKLQAKTQELTADVQFTQELFELNIDDNHSVAYCGVCCLEVGNMRDHVTSMKHLVAYMEYVKIKLDSLNTAQTKLNFNRFRDLIAAFLEKQLPKTEESPLEMVVMKSDAKLEVWLKNFAAALKQFTERVPKPERKKSSSSDKLEKSHSRSGSVKSASTATSKAVMQPTITVIEETSEAKVEPQLNDSCTVCRTKQIAMWKKHADTPLHIKKLRLAEFFTSGKGFTLVNESSALQADVEKLKDPTVGIECVTDFLGSDGQSKFWICNLCWVASKVPSQALQHLSSGKHTLNYIEDNFSDVKPVAKDIKSMMNELMKLRQEIIDDRGVGKLKLGLLKPGAEAAISKILPSPKVEKEAKAVQPCTSPRKEITLGDSAESMKPNVLLSTETEDLLWCEACYLGIIVARGEKWSVETAWAKHIKRDYHKKKWERRRSFIFDDKYFVNKPSILEEEIQKDPDARYVGLNDVVERRIDDDSGSPKTDFVCLLCADVFLLNDFKKHMENKIHLYQFVHRNYPESVRKLFFDPKTKGNAEVPIESFLRDKDIKPTRIRVYDSTATKQSPSKSGSQRSPQVRPVADRRIVVQVSSTKKSFKKGADRLLFPKSTGNIIDGSEADTAAAAKEFARELSLPNLKTDPLVKILIQSNTTLFKSDEKAYIQEKLDTCTEPLIGLQNLYEFQCIDATFEPGYLCKVCSVRMFAGEVIGHIVSNSHRLAYMEDNYRPYHETIKNQTNAGKTIVITKQYAATIERQEGRKVLTSKLTMKVDSSVLNRKKAAYIVPTVNLAKQYGSAPVGYPPPSAFGGYYGGGWGSTSNCPPPPGAADSNVASKPLSRGEDNGWNSKCAQFIQKVNGAEKESGTHERRSYERSSTDSHYRGRDPAKSDRHDRSPHSRQVVVRSRHSPEKDRRWVRSEKEPERSYRSHREMKEDVDRRTYKDESYRGRKSPENRGEKRRSHSRSHETAKRHRYEGGDGRHDSAEFRGKSDYNGRRAGDNDQKRSQPSRYPPVTHETMSETMPELVSSKRMPYGSANQTVGTSSSGNSFSADSSRAKVSTPSGDSTTVDSSLQSLLESLKDPQEKHQPTESNSDVSALLAVLGTLGAQSGMVGASGQPVDKEGNNVEMLLKMLMEQKERQKQQEEEREMLLKLLLQDSLQQQSGQQQLNRHMSGVVPQPPGFHPLGGSELGLQPQLINSLASGNWAMAAGMPPNWPQPPSLNAKFLTDMMAAGGQPGPIASATGYWSQPRPEMVRMAGENSWNGVRPPTSQQSGSSRETQLKQVEQKRMEALAKMSQQRNQTGSAANNLPPMFQPQPGGIGFSGHLGNFAMGGLMPPQQHHSAYGGHKK